MSFRRNKIPIFMLFIAGITLFLPVGCKKREEIRVRTGSILYFSYLGSAVEEEADRPFVLAFEDASGTAVTRNAIMPADVLNRKRDYLTGTQAPDVISWIKTGEDSILAGENLFFNLTDLWEEDGLLQVYPQAVAGACRAGEILYLMPFKVDTWKIFYRKSLFHAYNLPPPRSWEDFLDACTVLSGNGVTPVALGAKFVWPASLWFEYINIRVNGSSFHHGLMRGTIPFDREKAENALKYFALLVKEGVFTSDSLSLSWSSALKDFSEKKAGMYLFNDSLLNSLPPDIEADIGAFRFPLINTQLPLTLLGTVQGWVVPQAAQNTGGALQFLRFCGSAAGQQELAGIPETPLVYSSDMTNLEGADTILPELNRLALPVLREAVLEGTAALLADPSEESIARVVRQMEQAWESLQPSR